MSNLKIFKGISILYYLSLIGIVAYKISTGGNLLLPSLLLGTVVFGLFILQHVFNDGEIVSFTAYFNFGEDFKRIYHTNYNNLYISVGPNKIKIWYQGMFHRSLVETVKNEGTRGSIIISINEKLSQLYTDKVSSESWHNRKLSILDDWDGLLDEKSRRNRKLDEIL